MTPERLDALVGGGDPSEEEKHEYRRRLIARAEDGEADYDYGPGYSSTRSGTPTAGKSLRGDGEALFSGVSNTSTDSSRPCKRP